MPVSAHSKEIAKGTFWSLAGNMAVKLLAFFYLLVLARMAPQQEVGTFYLALSILGVFSIFTDFGLSSSFARYVPYLIGRNEGGKLQMLLRFTYTAVSALSIALAFVIFFAADLIAGYFKSPQLADVLRMTSPYLFVNALFSLNTCYLQGRKMLMEQSMLLTFQNLAKLAITLALFFIMGATLFSITAGFQLAFLVAAVVSTYYLLKELKGLPQPEGRQDYAELVREVIPFGLTVSLISSFWLLITYTDRILIGYLLDPTVAASKIAIYTVATSLAMLIMIFPTAIGSIFFPLVSELLGQGKEKEMREACETALRWTIFITFPLALVMVSFPDGLLRMFYGDSYAGGGLVLAIFTIGLLIRSLSTIQSLVLASMRMLRIELNIAIAAALLNVALNWLLIPIYDVNGAAFASAISFTVVTVLFVYYSRKLVGFGFPLESLKALVAGVVAFGLIYLARPYLSGSFGLPGLLGVTDSGGMPAKALQLMVFGGLFIVACLAYVAVLFLLKSFHHEDSAMLSMVLRRARVPEKVAEPLTALLLYGTGKPE